MAALAAGKTTTQTFTVRQSSIAAGAVTVTATDASGGRTEAKAAYGARTCG